MQTKITPVDLTITLGDIKNHGPCGQEQPQGEPLEGWLKLLNGLGMSGGNYDPNYKISLCDVAISNGIGDAAWCFRCLDWSDVGVRRYVVGNFSLPAAKRVSKLTDDRQVHDCLALVQRWVDGEDIDKDKLQAAARAARAAWAAADAAVAAGAERAARAARAAADAAGAADAAEREQQLRDLLAAFPPMPLSHKQEKRETDG